MDYSGLVFGDVKVLKRADGNLEECRELFKQGKAGTPIYTCECLLCGKIFNRNVNGIKNNKFKNCGCQSLRNDLSGKKFGKLTAIEPIGLDDHREMSWRCICDCGNEYIAKSYSLRKNITTQCWECATREISRATKKYYTTHKRASHPNKIVESEKYPLITKRLRSTYVNMKTRCYNHNYVEYYRYGGRGITVCDEWKKDFLTFALWAVENGYREDLTIDRIDNNGNYEPNNCRFVTRTEQANNRRSSKKLEYKGEIDTMANWARRLEIPYHYVQQKLYKGKCKSMEEVLNEFNNGARCERKKIEAR
jgi:RNase P/RNase MRP subunit POP5